MSASGRDERVSRSAVEATLFGISVAAEMAGMHAQTLRTYDRIGLVKPARTSGGGRRYSDRDVDLLREVQRLSQDEGVNLAGIKRIIELTTQVEALSEKVTEMGREIAHLQARAGRPRADIVPFRPGSAIVVWQPRNQR